MMAQGYRLVHVAGYGVNGVAYYAAIWEKRAGPPWQARHGLTGGQYQQTFNQLSQQGYRIRRVSGYFVAGAPYYAAIWEQRSGPPLQARHGLSGAGYQQFFDRMLAQGYRLDWVSGYQLGDDAHYAAIWEQRSGAPFQARHGMTAPDYQQTFNQMSAQQYRLRHVCGYSVLGLPYFAAIWEQRAGPPLGSPSQHDGRAIPADLRPARVGKRLPPHRCERVRRGRPGDVCRHLGASLTKPQHPSPPEPRRVPRARRPRSLPCA